MNRLLELEVRRENYILSIEEFKDCIQNFSTVKLILYEMYHGVQPNRILEILNQKDELMHMISTYCPELSFKLYGEEENYGWHETWVEGKRITFNDKCNLDIFIIDKLQKEYPDIYYQYVKCFYNKHKKIYDADNIIYNGLALNNEKEIQDPLIGCM